MTVFSERTVDAEQEEYYPIVKQTGTTVQVTMASDVHDLAQEDHHIQWIELIAGNQVYRRFLVASDAPEATFTISAEDPQDIKARAYCTQQGLCVQRDG